MMNRDLPSEIWNIIRLAILVVRHDAPIAELRKALQHAGMWPPSKVLKEIESKCTMDTD